MKRLLALLAAVCLLAGCAAQSEPTPAAEASAPAAADPAPAAEDPAPGKRATPGSIAFVPSAAGLVLAGEVVRDLIKG